MANFEDAFEYFLRNNFGLQEYPADPSGISKHGVSLRFLRSLDDEDLRQCGISSPGTIISDDVRNLTVQQVKSLLWRKYWLYGYFENVIRQPICNFLFEQSIKLGISPTISLLQRSLSYYYQNVKVVIDGVINQEILDLVTCADPIKLLAILKQENKDRSLITLYPLQMDLRENEAGRPTCLLLK